jgi:hypothetical protein
MMWLKSILLLLLISNTAYLSAQRVLHSQGFESNQLDSSWHSIMGNWRIEKVDDLRIAPAENGYRHVLCSGGKGYIGENLIRLIFNFPDTIRSRKMKISFSYYILANAPGTKIEAEFYQKEKIDGLRGKVVVADLPRMRGRWARFQKTLQVPARANSLRIVFFGLESSGKQDRIVCFDDIKISSL